jgi:Spy/CpxP family protein refolding chaperone
MKRESIKRHGRKSTVAITLAALTLTVAMLGAQPALAKASSAECEELYQQHEPASLK